MSILGIVLLVFFVIIAILLVLLVLAQNEEGDSLGGIFAGGSGSAFGSRSGNILTKATTVLGALFLVVSLTLALVNRSPGGTGVEAMGIQLAPQSNVNWWMEDPSLPDTIPETIFNPEMDFNPTLDFSSILDFTPELEVIPEEPTE